MVAKVPLYVSNGTAYVWSVDDIATLRTVHRICGTLSGTLPSVSQQNIFLGVPLTLLPEEVVTLVNTGAACLIDDPSSPGKPSDEQLRHWAEARKAAISVEMQERDAAARAPAKVDMSDKAQKKRLEREARKAQQQQQKQETDENVLQPTVTESPTAAPVQQTHTVHVPGSSTELPWYEPKAYHTIDEARAAGIWEYPRDVKERAECAVFRDLWEKGNYLGPGIKFGGNYLVYPGDPLRFHSHFVASVHQSPTSLIRPMDIVAFGRLGTATKKVHLLCGYDDSTGLVTHFSIEWASFG